MSFPKHSIELGVYKMAWGTCYTYIVAFPPEYINRIKNSGDFYKMPTYRLAIKPWITIKCLHTGWAKQICTKFKIYILATSVLLVLASWVRKIAHPKQYKMAPCWARYSHICGARMSRCWCPTNLVSDSAHVGHNGVTFVIVRAYVRPMLG